ncbi:MAG: Cytochrome bd-type quinol oxidase subunit 2-like protein [Conexibacter sp.]|nr:Cytochrome bd-type quinol oxidase subunit 2-like protein [Conexibacter sp.]
MGLKEIPLLFVLAGLVLYVTLAGADFGAGFWQLVAGRGERGERIREHAHDAMAPVWEANHVWLIFVLTVFWTGYPTAFGSIASTLAVPLFIAAIGIIFRGAAYALRAGTTSLREQSAVDTAFSISSVLTPFALGTVIGAIADERVPVGNAAGDMFSSWLNLTAVTIGVLAVVISAYLAAVYLAADAVRAGDAELEQAFRRRALGTGVVAGALAVVGLVVLHHETHHLYHELVAGRGLPALIVSVLAGLATLVLVVVRRYELSRYTAALAVAAIVAGWALAQEPVLLPGLTVSQAAAPHDTLVAIVVAVVGGGLILFPSLALLFSLTLRGHIGYIGGGPASAEQLPDGGPTSGGVRGVVARSSTGLLVRAAGACLVGALGFLTAADAGWAHVIGVLSLVGFIVLGVCAALPLALQEDSAAGD